MLEINKSQSTEEMLRRGHKLFNEKFMYYLQEILMMSRLSQRDTVFELGLGTQVFLTLVLALANNDIYLCVTLLTLVETVNSLLHYNKYIVYHMIEGFEIRSEVIQNAVQYLKKVEQSQLVNIPPSITDMLGHVSDILGQSVNSSATEKILSEETKHLQTGATEGVNECGESKETGNDRSAPKKKLHTRHEIMEFMKSFHGNANYTAKSGVAPLHTCVLNKNIDGVKFLLDIGAEINVQNSKGETCLLLAVKNGHWDIVNFFLQKGADTNISDEAGITPLFVAAEIGDLNLIKLLLDKGANIFHKNKKGLSVLYWCVKQFNRKTIHFFKEMGVNLSPQDICDAAEKGSVMVMELLKELGANFKVMNYLGHTPLHRAVSSGNLPVVKYLVGSGVDTNARTPTGFTPLHWAVHNNNETLVKFLVESGADPNSKAHGLWTPVHWAVANNNEPIVRVLVSAGGDPNARAAEGRTPLSTAVANNNVAIAKFLVDSGADMNSRDILGRTPLAAAFALGKPLVSVYLQSMGARL